MDKYLSTAIKLNRIIFVLSLIGVSIALYVTQSFLRQSPIVCVNTGCELVRKHPSSYLFSTIPVPAVGLVGYSLIALSSFLRTASQRFFKQFLLVILGIAGFGVLFVSWFTYTEIFVIKGICTWCAISTVNMVLIFFLALKSYLMQAKE